jgi:hypothetical protein
MDSYWEAKNKAAVAAAAAAAAGAAVPVVAEGGETEATPMEG